MKTILEKHSLSICLALGFATALLLTVHMALDPIPPFFDGLGYIMRGYALYGYLHTGQWHAFWLTLKNPAQSILPLHYLFFFLLPPSLAGFVGYVAMHNAVTFSTLAYAVYYVARVLNRKEWAPAIFLLTAFNNVALNNAYALYLDMPFTALCLLTIGMQLGAWQNENFRCRFFCGVALGIIFFLKPANALIFFATYSISEMAYILMKMCRTRDHSFEKTFWLASKGWMVTVSALIPMLYLCFLCGGGQVILRLLDQNEVQAEHVSIEGNIVVKLLYFPLCMSAFYNVLLLFLLLGTAMLVDCNFLPPSDLEKRSPILCELGIPVLISLVVFGEVFSLEMAIKPLRSLLIMAPALWFLFFYLWERRGFRTYLLSFIALLYAIFAFGQTVRNMLGSNGPSVERVYQLTKSSWWEMPTVWFSGSYAEIISHRIEQKTPEASAICVTSLRVWSILTWELVGSDLLQGRKHNYDVRYLLNYKGDFCNNALVGANVIGVVTDEPGLPKINRNEAASILDYGQMYWNNEYGTGWDLGTLNYDGSDIGAVFILNRPLTMTDVYKIDHSTPFSSMYQIEDNGSGDDFTRGRHYSYDEGWNILEKWYAKTFEQ